ncbi:hypothetical protein TVAG_065810 [Trichomonas vaginalis G3]|uniref:Uncharacterized protein n=1 Tax=Trichomonas vaginalis (strain ATCC PRA-98 / G3) TaxID=412133 RepID=A2ELY5_TRIV3|nr:hypothetical protein TVAGG3_0988670 [Trichomonas vaginalis G3]EAY06324.1 hypothetical protein TVAG_065810 [Trichomonas vaginalis G3]KAI5489860.1 hypothetical protein TVAGG3_0988670 [Trichomonas vaginalis G3]|eukprot:XP_001318547.1 hypothetical protein [Trichomonas vaginalis G3]
MNLQEIAEKEYFYQSWGCTDIIFKQIIDATNWKKETQRLKPATSLLRYFTEYWDELPKSMTYLDLFMLVKAKEERCKVNVSKGTANYYSVILNWFSKIVGNPEKFAQMVKMYFETNNSNLKYFARITFPNLFLHFEFIEFSDLSYKFLAYLVNNCQPDFYGPFLVSYFLAISGFANIFWYLYDQEMLKYGNKTQLSNIFSCFIKAISDSITKLPINHIEIARLVIDKDKGAFLKYFYGDAIKILYKEHSAGYSDTSIVNSVIEFLDYISGHPDHPQSLLLIEVFFKDDCNYAPMWPMAIDETENKAIIMMTCKEFFIIEDIVKEYHDILNIDALIKPTYLNPAFKDSLVIDCCEVHTSNFIKPGYSVKYNLMFEPQEKFGITLDANQSRLYKAIKCAADTEKLHIVKLISNQISSKNVPPLKDDMQETLLKAFVDDCYTNDQTFEFHIRRIFISRQISSSGHEASMLLSKALHYFAQYLFEEPKKEEIEKPIQSLSPLAKMRPGQRSSGFFRRLSININSTEANIMAQQSILTTSAFNLEGKANNNSSFGHNVVSRSIETSGKASTFFLDFEETPEIKPTAKKQRRNSGEFNKIHTAHKQKNIVNDIIKKSPNASELYLLAIIRSADSTMAQNSKATAAIKKFMSRVQTESIKGILVEEKTSEIQPKLVNKISKMIDSYKVCKPGTLMYNVLECLQPLPSICEKLKFDFHFFKKLMESVKTEALIATYVMYEQLSFDYVTFRKSLPNSLDQTGQYLTKNMQEYMKSLDPPYDPTAFRHIYGDL